MSGVEWRRHRFTWRGHRLRTYLWDARVARTVCRACWQGSGEILARTWRWVRAAPDGDRLLRLAAPAGALAGAGWLAARFPGVAYDGLVLAWLIAAAVLAPRDAWTLPPEPVAEEPVAEPDEPLAEVGPEDPRGALLYLLDRVTRGRNGVHLDELAKHAEVGLPQAELRPLLEAHQVPITRSLSVAGVAGRSGVRRADVEALLAALPQEGPAATLSPTLARVDLRKSQPLSPVLSPTLAAVSPAGDTQ